MIKRTRAGALAAVAVLLAAGCAQTDANEIALNYSGGPIEGVNFLRCIKPNSVQPLGFDDSAYVYRYGQVPFDFSADPGAQRGPIEIVSRDNVKMTVSGIANFALNTTCEKLRSFHESIAKGYGIDFGDDNNPPGWKELTVRYVGQPLARAMNEAAQGYDVAALYNDAKTYTEWAAKVGTLAGKYIQELTGDQYFCAPTYRGTGQCGDMVLILQKPDPPDDMEKAMASRQTAKMQQLAQEQVNARVETELKSLRDLKGVLGAQWAVIYQLAKDGKVRTVPVPFGGNLNVTADN
ncbi:SPFH domain-containing protein [Microbispora sp. NPDC049125]|uniref:SPFH domain-containing protein n=1 Tax=Microbispora sp. NPDC049125 TaxID=3154929 RepID=UPI0034665598